MKRLPLFSVLILSAVLLSSCGQKSFTNEFSGTIWEGVEISKELWDDQLGFPPDTTYHRLEFLDWSDSKVHHYYLSRYDGEWHGRGVFDYEITGSGRIRMEWEVAHYGDTLTRWFDVSGDMMRMTAEYEDDNIILHRVE